ncbi:MAG: carboxypeptidase-like regulatory domain-containing protein [Flavobacteriales bacterium]|nr:carboxypeptidase-like regulatory domain-containing protein [Flavobacteriales bacterium]
MKRFFLLLSCAMTLSLSGQEVIQFSGIIVTGDSLTPVPYANIIIENTNRGTTSDFYGYFSFVAQENDTVLFSALGYRKSRFVIPDSLEDKRYSLIQVLFTDTIQLSEVTVYPWASREAFAEAFINASPPDDDLVRARENLAPSRMLVMMETMDRDGFSNYKLTQQQYANQIYYSGQAPPINLMNPVAWASFIEALRDGSLKR